MKCSLKLLALGIGLLLSAFYRITDAADASKYFVSSLPGLPDNSNLKLHAGHITIDGKTNSNVFFWLIHNRHIPNIPKFVIWLNGGPGCSSMDGLFLENGPWRMNHDQTLRLTDGSWDEYANVLYVDFPVGTGFSFANSNSYPKNMTEIVSHFLLFIDNFFDTFPEYSKDHLYISGESFAGTFIPYMASSILKRNHERKTPDYRKYNLKGIAIGNGWIDPVSQYNAYYTFSVEKGLLDGEDKDTAEKQLKKCMKEQKKKPTIHLDICEQILQTILKHSIQKVGENETCINQYDIRDHSDSYPSCGSKWPYELSDITQYLRRADVIGAIHAENQQLGWVECNHGVGRGFDNDNSPPSVTLLPALLKQINVLLYSGDQDLICNTNGTNDMLENLEWNGHKGFQNLTTLPYFVNHTKAGYILSERNLTYVVVYNSSHMVPYDKPVVSMDMMYRFMGLNHHLVSKWPSSIGFENSDDDISTDTSFNEKIDKYYNAGTFTLVIVILAIVGLGAIIWRNRSRRRNRNASQAMKAAVESQMGEMDELVIESPLFQSDDVDHFGDSDPEDDNHGSTSNASRNKIRERNQGSRYQDSEDNDREERMRLRSSGRIRGERRGDEGGGGGREKEEVMREEVGEGERRGDDGGGGGGAMREGRKWRRKWRRRWRRELDIISGERRDKRDDGRGGGGFYFQLDNLGMIS
ncbi:pheromone-processing carboxypeptidase KEX1 [Rhizophagus irregularis DAOM 181602=DAOM 197198]|nr:pheromone-processing carboxypeptidase KEX1 [Rhizophagus irregularis DAOM 181602=DAOM 197198]